MRASNGAVRFTDTLFLEARRRVHDANQLDANECVILQEIAHALSRVGWTDNVEGCIQMKFSDLLKYGDQNDLEGHILKMPTQDRV